MLHCWCMAVTITWSGLVNPLHLRDPVHWQLFTCILCLRHCPTLLSHSVTITFIEAQRTQRQRLYGYAHNFSIDLRFVLVVARVVFTGVWLVSLTFRQLSKRQIHRLKPLGNAASRQNHINIFQFTTRSELLAEFSLHVSPILRRQGCSNAESLRMFSAFDGCFWFEWQHRPHWRCLCPTIDR